jgi:hypothetical protein
MKLADRFDGRVGRVVKSIDQRIYTYIFIVGGLLRITPPNPSTTIVYEILQTT